MLNRRTEIEQFSGSLLILNGRTDIIERLHMKEFNFQYAPKLANLLETRAMFSV